MGRGGRNSLLGGSLGTSHSAYDGWGSRKANKARRGPCLGREAVCVVVKL